MEINITRGNGSDFYKACRVGASHYGAKPCIFQWISVKVSGLTNKNRPKELSDHNNRVNCFLPVIWRRIRKKSHEKKEIFKELSQKTFITILEGGSITTGR